MSSKIYISVLSLFCLWGVLTLANHPTDVDKDKLGKSLVEKVWSDMKAGNIEALKSYMAEGFQSGHKDGTRNAEQELKLIAGLNLGDYKLSDFSTTMNGNTLIVTYFVSVAETINGKRMPDTTPTARMSTFVKTDDGWKWIGHANLR